MIRNKRFFVPLFLVLLVVLLAPAFHTIAQERTNFIFVRPLEIVTLDPAIVTESQSGFIIRNVYSRLVDTSYDGTRVSPDLAETWDVSDDGLVYTFHLRSGVTFHDGTPLKASDVAYSMDRFLSLGEGDSSLYMNFMDVGSTVAVDDQTVQITLKQPFSAFLQVMGYPRGTSVLSEAWVKANATDDDPWAAEFLKTNAMGTGPYTFVEWIPNELARMVRNDDYYGGPAPIEEVVSLINKDDTTTRLMLEKREVDAVQRLPEDMIRAMASDPNIVVYQRPTDSSSFWAFNLKVPPFDDIRVRKAIVDSVDYQAMMDGLVQEGGIRMNTPVYASMKYHDDNYPLPERNIDEAKSLLAEAGYADGLNIDLVYVDFGLLKQLAVVLQANLADAGIVANLIEMPFGQFLDAVGKDEIGFYSWVSEPNYPQAIAILERFTTQNIGTGLSGNISNFSDPAYDKLIEDIRTTTDEAKLTELYNQAQAMLMDNAVWLLLYQEQISELAGAWVEGFDFGVYNYLDMRQVSIKP